MGGVLVVVLCGRRRKWYAAWLRVPTAALDAYTSDPLKVTSTLAPAQGRRARTVSRHTEGRVDNPWWAVRHQLDGPERGLFHGGGCRALEGDSSERFGSLTGGGETRAYNVGPGRYYVEITSGCDDWAMTVARQ
jgi:hypothetical protein